VIRSRLISLPRRAWLTLKYLGPREVLVRIVTFPLRPTPLGRRLGYGSSYGPERAKARRWYGEHGRPITVVIPTYGDPSVTVKAVKSVRRTTPRQRVRIIVCDASYEARIEISVSLTPTAQYSCR